MWNRRFMVRLGSSSMNSQVKIAIGVVVAFVLMIGFFLHFSPYRQCMRVKAAQADEARANETRVPLLPDCGHLPF